MNDIQQKPNVSTAKRRQKFIPASASMAQAAAEAKETGRYQLPS